MQKVLNLQPEWCYSAKERLEGHWRHRRCLFCNLFKVCLGLLFWSHTASYIIRTYEQILPTAMVAPPQVCIPRKTSVTRQALTAAQALEAGVPLHSADKVAELSQTVGAYGTEPLADPLTLLRFYNAREGDIEDAAMMYKQTLEWRANLPIRKIMADFGAGEVYTDDGSRVVTDPGNWSWFSSPVSREAELALKYGFFGRLSSSAKEEPVLFWKVGAADFQGLVREGLVDILTRAWLAHLEDALQFTRAASFRTRTLVRARLIIDCQGLGISNIRFLPILKNIISLGKSYFPEVTASVTVLRAPTIAATLYSLVRPWLTTLMQQKICILGKDYLEGLQKHAGIDKAHLPHYLGGKADDTMIGAALRVPSGIR